MTHHTTEAFSLEYNVLGHPQRYSNDILAPCFKKEFVGTTCGTALKSLLSYTKEQYDQ